MKKKPVRLLLVEDDEDDYVLFRDVISEIKYLNTDLTWIDTYQGALESAKTDAHDIYVVDFLLGGHTGIDLLRELRRNGIKKPLIILTGQGDHEIDIQAMQQGAADYLEKERITPPLLERVIRYAMKEFEAMEMLRASEKRLRQLSSKLIDAQEAERKLIAKELHDSIGSNLAAVKFEIQKQITDLEKIDAEAGHKFKNLVDMIQETMEETRRICSNLRPSILDDLGLLIAIKWYCRKFSETYSDICINNNSKIREEEIPDHIKVVIFRIMQETLNNMIKHSGADTVDLVFEKSGGNIVFAIQDNGCGFDVSAPKSNHGDSGGMGLFSMKERVHYSGGELFIRSEKEIGTEIKGVWPGIG